MTDHDRLLTRAEVEARCAITRTTVYRLMRCGEFPEPLRVGAKAVRWSEREIEAWITKRPRSHGDGIHRAAGKRGGRVVSRRKGRNIRPCKVPGCTDETGHPGTARGYCSRHYARWLRHGDPAIRTTRVYVTHLECTVEGCTKRQAGRGLCARHWQQWSRTGDPTTRTLAPRWTPEEDKKLLDLPLEPRSRYVKSGYLTDLARVIGRTPVACRSRLFELRKARARAASLT